MGALLLFHNAGLCATLLFKQCSITPNPPSSMLVIFVVFISPCGRSVPSGPIQTEPPILGVGVPGLSVRVFPRDSFARIDPVRVHVHGGGEVVDAGLEVLAADFAVELADAELLVQLDNDGLFM